MGLTTYTLETMTFNNALETFTLRGTDYIYFVVLSEQQICGEYITGFGFICETFELNQMSLRSYTSLVKMAFFGLVGVFFSFFLKTQLNGCITVCFNSLYLCNYARTGFNYSAWNVLSLGTEDRSHTDFLSN